MPENPYKIATFVLAAVIAYDMRVTRHNRKMAQRIVQENIDLTKIAAHLNKQVEFLASKIDESNVVIDEFDRIIFTNL